MIYKLMDKFSPSGYYKYRYEQKTYKEKMLS